jgi:ubiquinol-cytochrome c reductase cytochrome b subunit
LGLHLYLVIHNGISEPPKVGEKVDRKNYRAKYKKLVEEGGVPFWPDIAWRDVVFAFIVIVGVVIIANLFNPHPLSKPPDPSIIDAVPRPDWWLLWDFAVLALMPPGIENIVMIGSILALVVALFSLPFLAPYGERHPARRPLSVAFVVVVMTVIGVLTMAGAKARWSPAFDAKPLPESVIGASSGQVYEGGQLFYQRGCEYCHTVDGYGGTRGPNLSTIGNQRTTPELTIRILNGGINMPAFASVLDPSEVEALVAFLESRRSY